MPMLSTVNVARPSRACVASLAGLALFVLSASLAEAASGGCVTRKTAYKTKDTSDSSTSTTWVKLPGTQVPFTQGGSGPGCVIVLFSGGAETAHTMVIRARIGGKVASPNLVGFTHDNAGQGAHAFNFLFPSIRPGERKVVIEWHGFYGLTIQMHQRSAIVLHR